MTLKVTRLPDFNAGLLNKRINPLNAPENSVSLGENIDLSQGGIKVRPGYTLAHNATNLTGTIRALWQAIFPTNEITYLLAQIAGQVETVWEPSVDGPDRHSHSLVYDAENDRDILFGGTDTLADYNNDVWSRDRTTGAWTELSPTGTPPSARHGHTAHYRAADGCMYVLYGKDVGGVKNDVFKLDLTLGAEAWSQVTTSGTAPTARYDHASCMIGTGTIMLCGGHGAAGGNTLDFITYYDLNCDTGAWTEIVGTAEGFPNSRSGHTVVYDGTQYAYVVGGNVSDEFYTATVYKLNRTTQAWVALTNVPSAGDTGLAYHCSLYCSGYVICVAGTGVVMGTDNAQYQVLNTTLDTWASVTPDGDIAPRVGAAMATDSDGNTVLHGGHTNEDPDVILDTVFLATGLCTTGAGTGIVATYGLYASNTHLPTTALVFEAIKELTADSGVCTFAVLGDRLIITEGISDVPHVFLPGTLSTDPVGSWASPMRVLVTYDGSTYHDISDKVLDNDLDSIADIGGIVTRGAIVIIADVPTLYGLYLAFQTPNTSGGTTTEFSDEVVLDAVTDISREDIGNGIARWFQDSAGATGHFEGPAIMLDGAAVDNSGNLAGTVSLPCATPHNCVVGDVVDTRNTVAYDASAATLPAQTGGDSTHLIVTHAYIAEVFAGDDEVRKRFTLGTGNDAELVEPGVRVEFSDSTEASIIAITGDGEADDEVEISVTKATTDCDLRGIIETDANVVSMAATTDVLATLATFTPNNKLRPLAMMTQVIKGADLSSNAAYVKLRFHGGIATLNSIGPQGITTCKIAERLTGSTPTGAGWTDITFNNGSATANVPPRYVDWLTGTVYAVDKRVTYADANYTCATAHTAGVFATDLAAGKWVLIEDAYVDSDLVLFTIDNTKDYLIQIVPVPETTTSGSGVSALGPTFAFQTKPIGDTHILYWSGAITGQTYGIVGVKQITGLTGALTAVTNLHVFTTNDASQMDITGADAIKQISATVTTPGASAAYIAVSVDQRQTWMDWDGSALRTIAKLESGTWRWLDVGLTWQDTGSADPSEALRKEFDIGPGGLTPSELAAVTEAQWAGLVGYPTLDFAVGLIADGTDIPTVTKFTVKVLDSGGAETSRWSNGAWEAVSVTDNTSSGGVSFGQDGTILPTSGSMTSDYGVIAGIPGYPFKINCRGTAVGTTLTKVRMRAPCQPLQNIGSGQPVAPMVVFHDVSAGKILDYSIQLADETYTELSSAVVPLETDDALYVGYLTPFTEIEIIPYSDNNDAISSLIAKYWNGTAWTALTVIDGTSTDGKTLRQRGKIKFAVPDAWKSNIPLEGLVDDSGSRMEILYWLQLSVSANVTSTTAIAEAKVQPVPVPLVKHRHVAVFQNRVALANRADAPDQIALSQPFLEYVWSGPYAANYRLGGGAVTSLLSAWNTLLAGQVDRSVLISQVSGQDSDMVPVEAARHVPINRQSIVSAPMTGADDGSRSGLFFLNRYGAYCVTGLQADPNFATARFQVLSDGVNWWESAEYPRIDLDYLHLACGEYWPARNWVVWSVPMILSGSSQATNNRLIVYDLTMGAWLPPFTIAAASLATAYEYNANAPGKLGALRLLAGNYSGQILDLFDVSATTDNGTAIAAYVDTQWLTHADPDHTPEWTKSFRKLYLYGITNANFTISIYKDGATSAGHTLTQTVLTTPTGVFAQTFQHTDGGLIKANLFKYRFTFSGPGHVQAAKLALDYERNELSTT